MVNQEIRQAKITKRTALLNDHASSGLRVADWCQENNISIHAYYYWKRIIKQEYVKSILPDIVPIGFASSEPIQIRCHTRLPRHSTRTTCATQVRKMLN